MDIGRLSINMNQGALKAAVGISLMKMQMNNNHTMADGMKEMMDEIAVDPKIGQTIDIKA